MAFNFRYLQPVTRRAFGPCQSVWVIRVSGSLHWQQYHQPGWPLRKAPLKPKKNRIFSTWRLQVRPYYITLNQNKMSAEWLAIVSSNWKVFRGKGILETFVYGAFIRCYAAAGEKTARFSNSVKKRGFESCSNICLSLKSTFLKRA